MIQLFPNTEAECVSNLEVSEWVLGDAIDAYFKVKMITKAVAGVADVADYFALAYAGSRGGAEL